MKPFQCTDCSKRFETDNGRADHQRAVHGKPVMNSILKPYQCTVCPKRFATDDALKNHMERSTNKKHQKMKGDISCSYPFCKRKFQSQNKFTPSALKQHLENPGNWHNGKVSDDIRENSSLDLNKFICDELQPNKEFHRLFNDAFNSLYGKLQTDLQDTEYATESTIHDLIKVGGKTAPRKLQTDLQDTEYATENTIHNLIKAGGQTAPRKPQTDLQDTEYATENTIHNLIKGGSIGKGTALKNDADLDCVMVMNSIDNASQLREKLPAIKRKLESCLRGSIGGSWKLASEQKETRFSLQFSMSRYPRETVEVDLLPTFEANVRDIDERERFYSNMVLKDEKNWRYYSAALVLFQRDFVVKRPTLVKSLIRLVKYWRKTFFPKNSAMPSYLLELLTIHAWENANRPERFDIKIGFKAVMEVLINHQSLRVSWGDYYREDLIPSSVLNKVKNNGAYIIDPANPTNNLYDDVDWVVVEMVAKVTKRKPLLRNVPGALANWK